MFSVPRLVWHPPSLFKSYCYYSFLLSVPVMAVWFWGETFCLPISSPMVVTWWIMEFVRDVSNSSTWKLGFWLWSSIFVCVVLLLYYFIYIYIYYIYVYIYLFFAYVLDVYVDNRKRLIYF